MDLLVRIVSHLRQSQECRKRGQLLLERGMRLPARFFCIAQRRLPHMILIRKGRGLVAVCALECHQPVGWLFLVYAHVVLRPCSSQWTSLSGLYPICERVRLRRLVSVLGTLVSP